MLNNLSKEPPIPFIGTVVEFGDQKEQISGQGWGWRYKIAIMNDYSSSKAEIDNSNIDYALALLPSTAGSGGANRGQSVRIAQGDVVYGHKIGGKRGISIILGIFGRTESIKYGGGRFDAKSGFYGKMQPKNLQGREEKGESSGNNVSRPLNTGSGSDKTKKRETPNELEQSQIDAIIAEENSFADVPADQNPDPASNTVIPDNPELSEDNADLDFGAPDEDVSGAIEFF